MNANGNGCACSISTPAPSPALEDRELTVLAELASDCDSTVAFQGLRRKLGIHQQALARTLRRLERYGLVQRSDGGYRATCEGCLAAKDRVPRANHRTVPVVQALLPPHVTPEAVVAHLSRRWFRGLRWYGLASLPGEVTLTWLTDPANAAVRLRIEGASVALEAEDRGGARDGFLAARAVLSALTELYGLQPAEEEPVHACGVSAGFAA